jgi:hypothetical protein
MSLTGKTEAEKLLRGKISKLDVIYTDTYEIAVKNGFEGTVDEWLESLKYVLTDADKEELVEQVLAEAKPYIDSYIDMGILEATLEQRGDN